MKRLLTVLLALLLLAGCAPGPAPETVPVQTTVPETTAVPETTLPLTDLMDGRQPVAEAKSLFRLENEALTALGSFGSTQIFGDQLLLLHYDTPLRDSEYGGGPVDFRLVLLDQFSGQKLAEKKFTGSDSMSIQICGDRIALEDWAAGTVDFLDGNLNVLSTYPTGAEEWGAFLLDPTGTYVYRISKDSRLIRRELATGREQTILDKQAEIYLSTQNGPYAVYRYLEPDTLRYQILALDTASGKTLKAPFAENCSSMHTGGSVWLGWQEGDSNRYLFGSTADPLVWDAVDGYGVLIPGPAPLYVAHFEDDGQWLSFYDENGRLTAGAFLPTGMGYAADPVWSQARQGWFVECSSDDGTSSLLFLDSHLPAQGPELPVRRLSELTQPEVHDTSLPQFLYDRAEALSRKYGVNIRIGNQCGEDYFDFHADRNLNRWDIELALNDFETAMEAYPKGFMEQLCYGNYSQVEINLTGAVTATQIPEDANGFTSFAAFVCHENGKHIMVLDVSLTDLVQTMYHEFSHIIDERLSFVSQHRKSIYSENRWESLNPPEFSYAGSVFELGEDVYDMAFDPWFIDDYARTNATEDRARILEYAMVGSNWRFEENAGLREKLAYYAASIRDGFDTTGWPEVTRWEEPLGTYRWEEKPDAA